MRKHPHDFATHINARMFPSLAIPATYYVEALSRRGPILKAFATEVFGQVDLWSHPPSASACPRLRPLTLTMARRERSRWRWASPSTRGRSTISACSDEHSLRLRPERPAHRPADQRASFRGRRGAESGRCLPAGHRLACTPAGNPGRLSNRISAMTRTMMMMTEIPDEAALALEFDVSPDARDWTFPRTAGQRCLRASRICAAWWRCCVSRAPRQMSRPVHSRS